MGWNSTSTTEWNKKKAFVTQNKFKWPKMKTHDKSEILENLQGFSYNIALSHYYPPASQASREVANSTERKNLHTPINVVK